MQHPKNCNIQIAKKKHSIKGVDNNKRNEIRQIENPVNMRFVYGAISCLLTATAISGFTSIISPSKRNRYALTSHASTRSSSSTTTSSSNSLKEVVAVATELRNEKITVDDERQKTNTRTKSNNIIEPLTEKEINARLGIQLNKMQAKDSQSLQLSKEVSVYGWVGDRVYGWSNAGYDGA